MRIGHHTLAPALILAPMAGITDKPMRMVSRRFGAAYAVSEMLASDPELWATRKSMQRRDHAGEPGPIGVQLVGSDPDVLAEAARFNVDQGADIIDINMGCPVRKVRKAWAGSALLEDEVLVGRILDAVVAAVDVPVTLKIRTGPSAARRNAVTIARIAESAGVAALAVHGRTREQRFTGQAEHTSIREIRQAVALPLIANGDITDPARACAVLHASQADALMIGRAACGRPWLFREIAAVLRGEAAPAAPEPAEIGNIMLAHVSEIHAHYGEAQGVRIARKHIGWYLENLPVASDWRAVINAATEASGQLRLIRRCIDSLAGQAGMSGSQRAA